MKSRPEDRPWKDLLQAARSERALHGSEDAEPAPDRFVNRIRNMRAGIWAVAKAVFWRRWSLVAVLLALLVYALCHMLLEPDRESTIPPPNPPQPISP